MRKQPTRLAAAFAIFLSLWPLSNIPLDAHASGNVLLPSDASGGNETPANLGLSPVKPRTAASAPATPDAAFPALPPDAEARQGQTNAGGMPSLERLPQSPALSVTEIPPFAKTPGAASPPTASAAAELLAKLAPGKETPVPSMPAPTVTNTGSTTIIKIAAMPSQQSMIPNMESLGFKMSRLAVSISNQSVWGPADIAKISDTLGLPSRKVSETCILSLRGTIITSESAAAFDTGAKGKDEALFSGTLSNVYATVQGLCPADTPVPPGKGIIQQIGGKYVIQLGFGNCSPHIPAPPTQLIVHYSGNGRAQCEYQ